MLLRRVRNLGAEYLATVRLPYARVAKVHGRVSAVVLARKSTCN